MMEVSSQRNVLIVILAFIRFISGIDCSCDDNFGALDLKWTQIKSCLQIKQTKKYKKLCNIRNDVKANCGKSCGTCDFELSTDCKNTRGPFKVGKRWRKCNNAKKRKALCKKEEFKFQCPQICDQCSTGGGGNTGGGGGNTGGGGGGNTGGGGGGGNTGGGGGGGGSLECSGSDPNCCLGLTNTCGLKINELFFAAMHNGHNDEGKYLSNHKAPLEEALEAGFRAFFLDVCMCNDELVFCHGSCFLGTQEPTEVFKNVVTFLDKNPSELVIFEFEISVDEPRPSDLWELMNGVDGMFEKSYVHPYGATEWPKIGQLLEAGKQIISFKHRGLNCYTPNSYGCTPYIQEFFKYAVATPWDFEEISDLQDIESSCKPDRGLDNMEQFYAIDNFVTSRIGLPVWNDANIINQDGFVKDRISDCERIADMKSNFIAVDFWQLGNIHEIANTINKERGAAL